MVIVEHKSGRKKICGELLQPSGEDGIAFLWRIITGEEAASGVAPSVVATQEKIQGTDFCSSGNG